MTEPDQQGNDAAQRPHDGAALYGVVGGVSASSPASDWVPGVRDVLTPAVMVVVLGFQVGALVLAAA